MLSDFRFAIRSLAKSPGFTAAAVAVLALGIGANTAIFSVVQAALLRPLPFPQADRLVRLYESLDDTDMLPLIRIKRAQLSQCPKPPPVLDSWLKPNWHLLHAEPEVLSVQNVPDNKTGTISWQFYGR